MYYTGLESSQSQPKKTALSPEAFAVIWPMLRPNLSSPHHLVSLYGSGVYTVLELSQDLLLVAETFVTALTFCSNFGFVL